MKTITILIIIALFAVSFAVPCFAQKSAADIIKAGLLGAGAGAIGGVASGGKGDDVWKGALAGAGVNIIGGSLLDIITRSGSASSNQAVYRVPNNYGSSYGGSGYPTYQQRQVYYSEDQYQRAYQEGYAAGYKAGYLEGFKEGLRESALQ